MNIELPKVRHKDGLEEFNNKKIVDSLMKETDVSEATAIEISADVRRFLLYNKLTIITAPLIREICNVCLLKRGCEDARLRYTRIGIPFYDLNGLSIIDSKKFQEKYLWGHIWNEYKAVQKLIDEVEEK